MYINPVHPFLYSHTNSVLACCLLCILAVVCTAWDSLDMDMGDQGRWGRTSRETCKSGAPEQKLCTSFPCTIQIAGQLRQGQLLRLCPLSSTLKCYFGVDRNSRNAEEGVAMWIGRCTFWVVHKGNVKQMSPQVHWSKELNVSCTK